MVAAAVTPNPEIVRSLVKLGADVNARDEGGKSALMFAAVNVDARTKKGYTALMFAAENNMNPEVIAELLKAGANPKITNGGNKRAIDYMEYN